MRRQEKKHRRRNVLFFLDTCQAARKNKTYQPQGKNTKQKAMMVAVANQAVEKYNTKLEQKWRLRKRLSLALCDDIFHGEHVLKLRLQTRERLEFEPGSAMLI